MGVPTDPVREIMFGSDTTLRWSCRKGDFVLWVRWPGLLAQPESVKDLRIVDCWQLRDGDYVTITNREADLPSWFTLRPEETANVLADKMLAKHKGRVPPGEPLDGPNLWRVLAGDRVVWVGRDRPGQPAPDGILALVEFCENALMVGETNRPESAPLFFGEFTDDARSAEVVRLCHAGLQAAFRLGMPNDYPVDEKWFIG